MIQKLNIIRNSAKEGEKTFRNKITVLIFRMLRYIRLLLFEIQSYYNKNERNQPYIKPDYRKYFPDAVVQKLDVLRYSAHEEEKLLYKTCFFIQFNVPFKIISLIESSQSIGGAKREYPGKTTGHTRKQNLSCLICGQCGARTYTRHSGEMIE